MKYIVQQNEISRINVRSTSGQHTSPHRSYLAALAVADRGLETGIINRSRSCLESRFALLAYHR